MMAAHSFKLSKIKTMQGVAAIEFAIFMTVFAPFVLGTIEIGRVLYQYNALAKSVRDSARYISIYSATTTGTPSYATRVTEAKCLAVFGNTACTGNPVVPGLSVARVLIGTDGNGAPLNAGSAGTVALKLISVRVTGYQLGYVTGFFTGGSKAFNDISATMRQATT